MVDLDNLFKYAAPKYVYIRDAKLGILKYTFMVAIFIYVVVYDIFIACTHLKPHAATGFGSMTLGEPAMECHPHDPDCEPKFDTIDTLKYCTQFGGHAQSKPKIPATKPYGGNDTVIERRLNNTEDIAKEAIPVADLNESEATLSDKKSGEDKDSSSAEDKDSSEDKPKVGDRITPQRNCRYVDNMRLTWEPGVQSELFIPTRFKQIKQRLNPGCYDPDAKTPQLGQNKYDCTKSYTTEVIKDYYVADIGEYHVALEHTFNCPSLGEYGSSSTHQGFFAACKSNSPMTSVQIKSKCDRMVVPDSEGEVAPEDLQGLINTTAAGIPSLRGLYGKDVISLGDLLKLTPVAQKHNFKDDVLDRKFPDEFGHPKESFREKGGILMLDVNYDNTAEYRPGFGPWPVKPITYTYRPSFVPSAENYKYQLVQRGDTSEHRIVDIWYGISIRMTFNGELVQFQLSKLLTALTTGLVLLASASTLVLYLAAYVLPLAEKYCLLLYQLSEDFTDYIHFKSMTETGDGSHAPQSMFWVGNLLLKKLQGTTEVERKLTDEEKVAILTTTEMRLNRLDGMDPLCVFDDGNEMDERLYNIGDNSRKFYFEKMEKKEIDSMSYKLQDKNRESIPAGESSQKLGKLKGT